MHEIENLMKINQKEILINKTEYEKINSIILGFETKLADIETRATKYHAEFVKMGKLIEEKDSNEDKFEIGTENDTLEKEKEKDKDAEIVIEVINYAY